MEVISHKQRRLRCGGIDFWQKLYSPEHQTRDSDTDEREDDTLLHLFTANDTSTCEPVRTYNSTVNHRSDFSPPELFTCNLVFLTGSCPLSQVSGLTQESVCNMYQTRDVNHLLTVITQSSRRFFHCLCQ